jgi:multiple sugar transport system ATP-binding protein
MTDVRLTDLTKKFGDFVAVDAINLTINDGEFVVLVGPSGCGKTTSLRMVAGLEDVTSGSIYIGERDVARTHAKDRNVAMVFQSYALYPHMTVEQNLGFALKLRKLPKAEIAKRVHEVASTLGITEELPRKPKTLSGGQQQRVALGRAIVRNPAVFLFDEPLSNLDAKLRTAMRAELIKLHHRLGATMIYVTHDQVEAMTMGDRIVVMNEGTIQQAGSPLEVYDDPANVFVAGFIGSPAMNLLAGRPVNEAGALNFTTDGLSIPLPVDHAAAKAASVRLGIRPEFLQLNPPEGWATFEGHIEVVEHLGAETILYLSTAGPEITAKIKRSDAVKHGTTVRIGADPVQVLAFDEQTGERLRA